MKKLLMFLGMLMLALVFSFVGMAGAVESTSKLAVASIPEPATLVLFGSGLIGLAAVMRKFKKK